MGGPTCQSCVRPPPRPLVFGLSALGVPRGVISSRALGASSRGVAGRGGEGRYELWRAYHKSLMP